MIRLRIFGPPLNGDIGGDQEEIELEPLTTPATEPIPTPAPAPAQPTREPEQVPA